MDDNSEESSVGEAGGRVSESQMLLLLLLLFFLLKLPSSSSSSSVIVSRTLKRALRRCGRFAEPEIDGMGENNIFRVYATMNADQFP